MAEPTPPTPEQLPDLHPADLADHLQRLPDAEAQALVQQLPAEQAAAALAEVEQDKVVDMLADLSADRLAELLPSLPAEAAVDLLQQVPPARRREVLLTLPSEIAGHIRTLLRYPEDSAGGIMTSRVIALRDDMTVDQVRTLLRNQAEEESTQDIAYLYVTDAQRRLVGIVSLRDIAFRLGGRRLDEIMRRDVKSLHVADDQEKIAQRFAHYHYLGLPVLDDNGRLVGVVRASDALAIATKEATEDMQLMVGLSGEERALTPWTTSISRRLPWLCVNLATAFLAAAVVGLFEGTIAKWTALAVFLPIVAGQGGNAGMQTLTVIIRDLALGKLTPGDGRRALLKEVILGLFNGLAIGLIVGVVGWLWKGSAVLGVVAAVAMLLNQLAAGISGVLIPLGLKWCRLDPAMASSIFLTTVTDVAGFFFFLGLAALALTSVG